MTRYNIILDINVDDSIKNNYCVINSCERDPNTYNINIYTNGEEEINFRKMIFLSPILNGSDDAYLNYKKDYIRFANNFLYGKNIIKNADEIYITGNRDAAKPSSKDIELIAKTLKNNRILLSTNIKVDLGEMTLTDEDMEALKPLNEFNKIKLSLDDSLDFHSIDDLKSIHDIINETLRRVNSHEFTQLEQLLYIYDLFKTNFVVDKKYSDMMDELLEKYDDPSYCYSYLFQKVLDRLNIKNTYSIGDFAFENNRAYNILYIKDDAYEIEGIYYFDIANNSKQKYNNSFMYLKKDSDFRNEVINNYIFFAKTKKFMEDKVSLGSDLFGEFDEKTMAFYETGDFKISIKAIYEMRSDLNQISRFVDNKALIDNEKGIRNQEEFEEIKSEAERYGELLGRTITGEDFLELLFNVRSIEYQENGEIFPLNVESLKECLQNSHFPFEKMLLEFSEEETYEQEDIDKLFAEAFEECFEKSSENAKINDRIKMLKITLNNKKNKPRNDNNK